MRCGKRASVHSKGGGFSHGPRALMSPFWNQANSRPCSLKPRFLVFSGKQGLGVGSHPSDSMEFITDIRSADVGRGIGQRGTFTA